MMLLVALLLLALTLCVESFLIQPAPRAGVRCSSNTQDHEPSHLDPPIAVIGAGVGGLATAARLAKAGAKVIVVEKNSAADVGGRVNEKLLGTNEEYRLTLLRILSRIMPLYSHLGCTKRHTACYEAALTAAYVFNHRDTIL
jgi:NAD(P)-binding Rossmann-like domain